MWRLQLTLYSVRSVPSYIMVYALGSRNGDSVFRFLDARRLTWINTQSYVALVLPLTSHPELTLKDQLHRSSLLHDGCSGLQGGFVHCVPSDHANDSFSRL